MPTQKLPHMPQCRRAVSRFSSQPFAGERSHSPKFVLQPTKAHEPLAQSPVPPGGAQREPQLPQSVSVRSDTSQPVAAMRSQSPRPASHRREHVPPAQTAVAPGPEGHTLPQPPQCAASEARVTSQPSEGSPLQSARPARQLCTRQMPPRQIALAPGSAQAVPHAPQFATSVSVSVQVPSHASGAVPPQAAAQAKLPSPTAAHNGVPPAHGAPHAPQFVVVLPSVSQPVVPRASQSRRPGAQLSTSQVPVTQLTVAPAPAQEIPQPPQSASVRTERSHPFAARPSQSAQPSSQAARTHALAVHETEA